MFSLKIKKLGFEYCGLTGRGVLNVLSCFSSDVGSITLYACGKSAIFDSSCTALICEWMEGIYNETI